MEGWKANARFFVLVSFGDILSYALIKFLSDDYGYAQVSVVLRALPMLQMQLCRLTACQARDARQRLSFRASRGDVYSFEGHVYSFDWLFKYFIRDK